MLYSRINSSERKYMFLEILQKKRDLKKLVKFSFYIKKVANYDLSPKTDKTCYLIGASVLLLALIKFLRLC